MIFHLDDGSVVDGHITIPRRGMRMSDYLSASEREFINVESVTLTLPDDRSEYTPFIMIARKSIRMIKPGPRDEKERLEESVWGAGTAKDEEEPPKAPEPEPEPVDPRAKTGIYPPRNPALHVNRPPSGVHKVPEELKKKKS